MTLAREIGAHLPYLRRFARALCGSQAKGDAHVAATLEALVEHPERFPTASSSKVGLYTLFLDGWNGAAGRRAARGEAAANDDDATPAASDAVDHALDRITPRPRQAFLLHALEGFSDEDCCEILRIDEARLAELLAEADRAIATETATDVLVIEDEPVIVLHLESLLEELGHRVVGVAATHGEAVALARETRPGLVLADIQLADGSSGLDAVEEILGLFDVPVIFVTAYPQRLLTGTRREPTYLVTKPYNADSLKATISQALFFYGRT
jgi:DNA-directed RNA polymerase specialized sigma24 family protein/CheY-like chemotaxis protein